VRRPNVAVRHGRTDLGEKPRSGKAHGCIGKMSGSERCPRIGGQDR
jgi:hypothetical protein